MNKINIYTDGSSIGNPGPGGYAFIIEYLTYKREYFEGFRYTTNNRMELLAVISSLELINTLNQNIVIFTDSKYIVEPICNNWIFNWESNGFKKKTLIYGNVC